VELFHEVCSVLKAQALLPRRLFRKIERTRLENINKTFALEIVPQTGWIQSKK
jgi:hypothetical protein